MKAITEVRRETNAANDVQVRIFKVIGTDELIVRQYVRQTGDSSAFGWIAVRSLDRTFSESYEALMAEAEILAA